MGNRSRAYMEKGIDMQSDSMMDVYTGRIGDAVTQGWMN